MNSASDGREIGDFFSSFSILSELQNVWFFWNAYKENTASNFKHTHRVFRPAEKNLNERAKSILKTFFLESMAFNRVETNPGACFVIRS